MIVKSLNNFFNLFRRKSGLLNVMAKRGLRSRIMSKTGSLRTMRFGDGKKHKFLKDIFISIIALVRSFNVISIKGTKQNKNYKQSNMS